MIRHIRVLATISLLAWVALGCVGDAPSDVSQTSAGEVMGPETTTQPSARGFHPLAIGNSWKYSRRFELTIVPVDGGSGGPTDIFQGSSERRLIGTEEIFGREYITEATKVYADGAADTVRWWRRFRQDHAGLYLADVPSGDPPASVFSSSARTGSERGRDFLTVGIPTWDRVAKSLGGERSSLTRRTWQTHAARIRYVRAILQPGVNIQPTPAGRPCGPLFGEIRPLEYPLHPKAEFVTRMIPFRVRGVVEAQEVLDLPAGRYPGYRIRIENQRLDPDDRVYVWHGMCGELGSTVHLETIAVDIETGEMVRIITDETEWLSDFEFKRPDRCRRGPD
ncbi:MAG: hypothetical protein JSW58_16945 [Candidatus Latescibacterota bacterium]|nr:MAG: hypothetical protein JSW58_16945 [Candidatus Latescibacterota bacterium]